MLLLINCKNVDIIRNDVIKINESQSKKNHIMLFLGAGHLWPGNSFGVRKGSSCTINLLQFYDKVA